MPDFIKQARSSRSATAIQGMPSTSPWISLWKLAHRRYNSRVWVIREKQHDMPNTGVLFQSVFPKTQCVVSNFRFHLTHFFRPSKFVGRPRSTQ
jgi:hypothetical protein